IFINSSQNDFLIISTTLKIYILTICISKYPPLTITSILPILKAFTVSTITSTHIFDDVNTIGLLFLPFQIIV
ncbi:MAG: hypothetical protein QXP12_08445, partial [Ignisphaera sp.]